MPSIFATSILYMPHEIQREFLYAAHEAGNDMRPLSQVCRLWRKLSVKTSRFWTDINIDVLRSMNWQTEITAHNTACNNLYSVETYRELLPWPSTVLERSGSQPITVNVRLLFGNTRMCAHCQAIYTTLVLRLLVTHAPRFKSFTIVADIWEPIRSFSAALFDKRMPVLERWDATLDGSPVPLGRLTQCNLPTIPDTAVFQHPWGIVHTVEIHSELYPKLDHLSLRGIIHRWERFLPQSLVTLELSNLPLNCRPTFEAFMMILLNSQNTLKELTLSASAPLRSNTPTSGKINLSKLEKLHIGYTFSETVVLLPEFLEVPALRSLKIHDMTYDNPRTRATQLGFAMNESNTALFHTQIFKRWPMQQLKHLKLETPHSPGKFNQANLIQLYRDIQAGRRRTQSIPLFTTLFLGCHSVECLNLVDPDLVTLMALATPVALQGGEPGVLPCYRLNCLHISTRDFEALSLFMWAIKFGAQSCHASRLKPRFIPSLLLDVPPAWGTRLREFASRQVCTSISNFGGYFEVGSDRVTNLLDSLPLEVES
ncbi:hypothetical protein EV361DRAFT_312960 [Lentinula raphanica]|uniref:F-box domain-containing protein n=1 Tax=Lentinula raphanica TaxID=153919 RepID=A0AA38UDQ0_9AGAR|nr:hypothetical protein F5880DRAFT_643905 [Lentinula raphanica]KAJ3837706.1 hypothetical protein F5878DRAFT_642560 [Lentinula raphanica]KAJ3970037.1 hypothetical protein EV361DRAFT_312960 [Lentinula raphanica]